MTEKETMTATFDLTPEARDLLISKESEYIVANPVVIEATLDDGRTMRYPKNIRERIVRCLDCKHAAPCPLVNSEKLICELLDEMLVSPRDFCSWGRSVMWNDR